MFAWRWRGAYRMADGLPRAPARCPAGAVVDQATGSADARMRPRNPLRAPAFAGTRVLVNARSRRPVEPDDLRTRRSPPGAMFGCVLVVAALTGGCTVSGDRAEDALDTGRTSADVQAATEPVRTVGVAVDGIDGALARNTTAAARLRRPAGDPRRTPMVGAWRRITHPAIAGRRVPNPSRRCVPTWTTAGASLDNGKQCSPF